MGGKTVSKNGGIVGVSDHGGWAVFVTVARDGSASQALHVENFEAHFLQMRRKLGPPWSNDHRLAMAAAVVTATALSE